jgi:hypothetical protein
MGVAPGAVAEWLRSGLQSRVHRFDSGRRLSIGVARGRRDAPRTSRTGRARPASRRDDSRLMRYAVVTPARNEAANLARLARCLLGQTAAPALWVIVDNGSTDGTDRVAARLAASDPAIVVRRVPCDGAPSRGRPVARAFTAGLEAIREPVDVIVKLEADVSFPPELFAGLLAEFERDPALGIAAGTCSEPENGQWRPPAANGERTHGAARAYRRACLDAVLRAEGSSAGSGIDERAVGANGWRTACFAHLRVNRHRPGAEAGSSLRAAA